VITDPAPDWVSPHWAAHYALDAPAVGIITFIHVLNPGAAPAKVTVTFHQDATTVYETSTKTIAARSVAEWAAVATQDVAVLQGWVSITSDHPVLPHGTIRGGSEEANATEVPMTFGRWGWAGIKPPHFSPV
jgi:hypothetical protein